MKSIAKHAFQKVRHARGYRVRGLWKRNGTFYAQLRMGGRSAKKIPLHDCRTIPQCLEAIHKLKAQRREGLIPALARVPKFREYAQSYLDSIHGDKRPATIAKERSCLAGWAKHLGELRLNQITPLHVDEYLLERKAHVGGRTRDLDVLTLNGVLKRARRHGFIKTLPTAHHEKLANPAPRRPLWPVSALHAVCDQARQHCRNGQQLSDYLLLMALCGARRDETLRLLKSDIDWTFRKLTIGADGLAKNHLVRQVDFNRGLEEHLRDMARREDPHSKWLFPSPQRGRRDVRVRSFREVFDSAKKKAGFEQMQFHDMRHFFISYCLMSGVDVGTVARWVGHQDGGALIGKTYAHLCDEHTKRQAEKLDLLGPAVDSKQLRLF